MPRFKIYWAELHGTVVEAADRETAISMAAKSTLSLPDSYKGGQLRSCRELENKEKDDES